MTRLKQKITVKMDTEVIEKVICDFCKEPIEANFTISGGKQYISYLNGGEVEFSFGYGSKFDDLVTGKPRKYDICDKCAGNILPRGEH